MRTEGGTRGATWGRRDAGRGIGRLGAWRWGIVVGVSALVALPARSRAQVTKTLDEGSFDISIAGRAAGKETFVIRREGLAVKAVGVVHMDSARPPFVSEQVWLQTDTTFQPELFQLKPRSGDVQDVIAHRDGNRLRLQTTSKEGNRSQQFVAAPRMAILEPGVAHEYYLLFREHAALGSGSDWSTPVIVPSLGERASVQVQTLGPDHVQAAGEERSATRYRVTLDREQIQVWLDDQGRVLRVSRPDRQWTATRSSMKR